MSTDDRDRRALWLAQRLTIDTQGNSWINLQPCLGNFFAATKTIAIIITYFNKYDSTFYEKIFTDLKQR